MRILALLVFFVSNLYGFQTGERYKNEIVELKEELSIGIADGPEEYTFNRPNCIEVDSEGTIYVADGGDKVIKVYNPEGEYLRTIGKSGSGPGEFRAIGKIKIGKENKLYTHDYRLRRISIFNFQGQYEQNFTFSELNRNVNEFFLSHDGKFILVEKRIPVDYEKDRDSIKINLYLAEMVFIRTVFSSIQKDLLRIPIEIKGQTAVLALSQPFSPMVQCNILSDGKIVYGNTESYTFFIHSIETNETKKVTGKYKPVKVSSKERNKILDGYVSDPMLKNVRKTIEKSINFPKEKPAYRNILIDDTGYVLFETFREDDKKGDEYDIFDFDGNFIKKVYFRNKPGGLKFRNGKIFGIVRNEEGWSKVVRFRIE